MAGTIDGQLKASAFAKAKQGAKKSRECGSTEARIALGRAIRQGT